MKQHTKAVHYFQAEQIQNSLNKIYRNVPNGTCAGSTNCCSESVNTFYAEFINMVLLLQEKGKLEQFTKRAVRYYLTELVRPMKCPMLQDDGLCVLYDARPLPCRVFGNLNRDEYDENYEAVLGENSSAVEALKTQFNIDVPQEVSHSKVEYCTNFSGEQPFTLEQRDELVDQLFMIDSRFLSQNLLTANHINMSLVQWFAYAVLGEKRATKLRIRISQEISASGKSSNLEKVMNNGTMTVKTQATRSSSMNKFCQSCGMPLKQDPEKGGTETDGSKSTEYCSYCYKDGAFLSPEITTAQEMQVFCIEQMKKQGMPKFIAWLFTRSIPKLKRWQ